MIMKTFKRILTLALAVMVCVTAVPAAAATIYVMPKEDSPLTVDADGSGYIRGIWGTTTAGKLMAQFDSNVTVRRGDTVLGTTDAVASDDRVWGSEESFPVIIYGDTNRDGKVNLADVSLLLKAIAGWDAELCTAAADVTLNGKGDLGDASLLLKWVANWDVTLGDAVFPKTDVSPGGGFSIVIPEDADSFEREAAEYLSVAIDGVFDTNMGKNRIITDSEMAEREILVGDTSRSRTAELQAKLEEHGRGYSVPTDKTIVIAGGDSIGTYEAVQAFVWDIFGYIDSHNTVTYYDVQVGTGFVTVTTGTTISTGTEKIFDYEPAAEEFTVGGTDISEFDIVTKYPDDEATAVIRRAILRETGDLPDIVKSGEEEDGPAIRLGIGKADGTSYRGISRNVFAVGVDGGDIVIDVAEYKSLLFAARAFVEWYVEDRCALSEGDVHFGGVDSNMLMPTSVRDTDIADGITYSEIRLTDARDQPVKAHLVTVENGAERILMGTPGGGTAVTGVSATVQDAIDAAEADGFDIAAGINADFFHIESDYRPQGLCVKDGVILKQNDETRPWIAVMKDGTLDCGIAGEARSKIGNMQIGFGASHVMLKDGIEYQVDAGNSFAEIRHPRTAMGYDSDGTVYLLVVDGRQPTLSNGATLLDLMLILKNAGADHAVNLDGGGSSTMIVDDGGFDVKNSPSDGALRKIYNSVLITK